MPRSALVLAVLVAACDAPTIAIATATDAATEADVVDARPLCPTVIGPDGKECTGTSDEDRDCIPDECDDCPNVPQVLPMGRAPGIANVGARCVHPAAPFDAIGKRLRFETFATLGPWSSRQALTEEGLTVAANVASLGQPGGGNSFVWLPASNGAGAVVVLARMRITDGDTNAGVFLRASADFALQAYECKIDATGLSIVETMSNCTPSGCNTVVPLRDEGGAIAGKPLPFAAVSAGGWFYLRASVSERSIECQVYPDAADADAVRLRDLPPNANTVRAVLPDPFRATGAVGFFANRTRIEVSSIDVLVP